MLGEAAGHQHPEQVGDRDAGAEAAPGLQEPGRVHVPEEEEVGRLLPAQGGVLGHRLPEAAVLDARGAGRCRRRHLRRPRQVRLHDGSARAAAGEGREVLAALHRQPAGLRRGGDAGRAADEPLSRGVSGQLGSWPRRRLGRRVGRHGGVPSPLPSRRRGLAGRQQVGDRLADRDLVALTDADAAEDPFARRLDLDHGLVGLDLHQGLAPPDVVTLVFEPADQPSGLLGHPQGRHDDGPGHLTARPP